MGALSENGAEEPTRRSVIFWGTATGGVAAVMLLAGGSEPAEALNGLKNITIVSALPFVIVMLLLCVAIWKDLSQDPLILQGRLATILLEESVATAVDEHGQPFEIATNIVVVDGDGESDGDGAAADGPADAAATPAAGRTGSTDADTAAEAAPAPADTAPAANGKAASRTFERPSPEECSSLETRTPRD